MAFGAPAAAAASPEGSGHEDACSVLLDVQAYIGASKNASTARSKTSTGHTIGVTFCIVPPPALSRISVHCPDLQLPPDDLSMAPQAVATTDDLIVLRVPIDHLGRKFFQFNDYFVYRAQHQYPKLDLLPNPQPYCFRDQEIAILSCGSVTADGGNQYVVAALKIQPSFRLHLYRSKPGGETGSWTVHPVSVEKPLRDSVCPIPDTAQRLLYHLTTSVITLGGANGTVGWVDLWRGILLCDVLEERPKLRDIPLPLPAKGNWRRFLRDGERFVRDITVSQHKDSIKYVEMEIVPPRVVTTTSSPDPATYLEWVHHKECLPPLTQSVVPGQWKATTWSMPIPVTSWDDWHTECTAESQEFHVSDPRHRELLQELMSSSGGGKEAKQATLSLGSLHMGYPAFSIDDDVVYLSCKAASRGLMGLVAAVDMRKKELRGVAKLDIERNTCFMRSYIATEISKYLKTTDESLQEISSAFGPTVGAKVISDVATECVCSSGMDDSVMLKNVTSGTAVPSLVDLVELSPSTKTHEINMVGTTNDIDEKNQNEKCDRGLTSHQGNEMHITDNLEEKELNQEVIVDTIPHDANVISSTDSPEENEQNEESIAGTSSGKIGAVQRVTSTEEFEVNVASKESNVTSVIAMAEEKKQDEIDMKNHEIEGACSTQATGENNTPIETNAGTVTDDVEDKMPNEEIATGTITHITDSSINEERMDNGEVTEGLGSHENIVVHGSDNVEGKMYKETRTSPIVDKFSLPNSTEVVEERKDGKTSANPTSHETNVAHTTDSVDKKNEEQAVVPTSSISTVGGMGNAEDKHSEETSADPSSVENATTTQVTDTEDAENSEQNENTTSTEPASDEAQVELNTNVTDDLNRATCQNRETANKEMPTSSDNTRSTSTDPASDEVQVAQNTNVTDDLNRATYQNREMAKEMPTSSDNKPSTSTDPASDEPQVARNTNVTDDLNRATYQNREMANREMPARSDNKRLSLRDLLAMEAKKKENKRSSFRRWYLKTTCRS